MTETSIVTVVLPGEQTVVKLLEPLSHSTCSCHSRELCPHKAQALLAYQLKKGRVSLKELEALLEEEASFDLEEVRTAADAVCEAVEGQLATGLARQSKDVEESLERLAVLCRQAGLAQLENTGSILSVRRHSGPGSLRDGCCLYMTGQAGSGRRRTRSGCAAWPEAFATATNRRGRCG